MTAGSAGLLGIVRALDGAPEASRDGFTAVPRRPAEPAALRYSRWLA